MSGEANSKLSDERVTVLLTALEQGDTRRSAAATAGIHVRTLYNWLERDDGTLLHAIEKAEATAEHNHLAVIVKAAVKGNWQASAWWLERRLSDTYARRERLEVKMDLRAEVTKLAEELGLDAEAAIAEAEALLHR